MPSQLNPDVPARLDAVVMKALSKNPSNRYQTAEEFSADLERVIKGQDVEATPLLAGVAAGEATQVISRPQQTAVLPPMEEPEGFGQEGLAGVLIGILVVAVLAGGGYLLVSSLTDDNEGSVLVVVPDLVGMTRSRRKPSSTDRRPQARAPGTARPIRPTPTPAPWSIRTPKDGVEVAKGADVTIFIAVEPTTTTVPDLAGTDPVGGTNRTRRGRTPPRLPTAGTERRRSRQGRSLGPSPPAGSEVEQDSVVDVYVSTGPEQVDGAGRLDRLPVDGVGAQGPEGRRLGGRGG